MGISVTGKKRNYFLPVGETLPSADKSDSCLKTGFFTKTGLLSLPGFPTLSPAGDWISLPVSPFP